VLNCNILNTYLLFLVQEGADPEHCRRTKKRQKKSDGGSVHVAPDAPAFPSGLFIFLI
jgi:hypothetical protein